MGANVMDFTDLGKGTEFSYKGEKFEVPSYTKPEMTELMKISERMVGISKNLNPEEKEGMERGEIKTSSLEELFKVQQEFVIAGVRQITNDGVYAALTLEKIEAWPWKLINKVSSLVQDMMGSVSGAEKDDKGKNPTKEK